MTRAAAFAVAAVLAACARPAPTAAPPRPSPPTVARPTGDLVGFGSADVEVGGERLRVAVADDPDRRARGFVGVEDTGDVDGILFTWGGEVVDVSFHMRGVPIPLDLAVFDGAGRLLGVVPMAVCPPEPCTYDPPGPFAYALETPAGTLRLGAADRLVLP